MDLVNYFSENHAQLFYLIAGLSFIIELTVLGMSGPLLFFAIASVFTGILIQLNLVTSWETQFLLVGVLTGIITLLLWKPLKQFQNSGNGTDTSSDMIGKIVPSSTEITLTKGKIRFSGIDWNAKLASDSDVDSIKADSSCVIVAVEGNVMIVKLA